MSQHARPQQGSMSEYETRDARNVEVFKLAEIVKKVLEESTTYRHMMFDAKKTQNYIMGAILKQKGYFLKIIVHKESQEPVGGLLCECWEAYSSQDKIAFDVTVMIEKEHRGKCIKELVQIIEDYKAWALGEGAKVIKFGVSSGLNIDRASRFFEKMGFPKIGAMHALVVGEIA